MAKWNNKVPLKVQKRSGFDKSHFNLLTSLTGVITPILLDEVIPNTKVNLRLNLGASMPPLAADTFMKCDIAVEAFFVPLRLTYGGFEAFFCQREENFLDNYVIGATGGLVSYVPNLPVAHLDMESDSFYTKYFGHRGLPDFLGWRSSGYAGASMQDVYINPLPFVAYHLIYEHYYRAPLVQKNAFVMPGVGSSLTFTTEDVLPSSHPNTAATLPFNVMAVNEFEMGATAVGVQDDYWKLADGTSLWALRKRNFGFDYFTNAFPSPQMGSEETVNVGDGYFTIASLRAANSMQMFKERNNIPGGRYQDSLKARYNANLSDGVAQRPVLLGTAKYNVYNKSMVVSATNSETQNPFSNKAGGVQGNAYASGSDLIISGFTANEPGYIIVNATLVPTVTYSCGIDRVLTRYTNFWSGSQVADMADPILQNTGNQPIYNWELSGNIPNSSLDWSSEIFGYTDRYADWMTMPDTIHGLFRDGLSLEAFAAQRYFGPTDTPVIGTAFLQIPTTYLDNVTAVASQLSTYGYWLECQFDYKVSMPLAEYSIPSLQDPAYEHGDTVVIHRGGFRF